MSSVNPGIVKQRNLPDILASQKERISLLEAQVGRWSYVTPIAPAAEPPDYAPNDPNADAGSGWGVFVNGWGNVAAQQPVSFRIHPATKVQIRGGVTGGSLPSVVFKLPPPYRPTEGSVPVLFSSLDGTVLFTGRIDLNGDVNILASTVL